MENNNFSMMVLVAIVAIIAVISLTLMVKTAPVQQPMVVSDNMAGQTFVSDGGSTTVDLSQCCADACSGVPMGNVVSCYTDCYENPSSYGCKSGGTAKPSSFSLR